MRTQTLTLPTNKSAIEAAIRSGHLDVAREALRQLAAERGRENLVAQLPATPTSEQLLGLLNELTAASSATNYRAILLATASHLLPWLWLSYQHRTGGYNESQYLTVSAVLLVSLLVLVGMVRKQQGALAPLLYLAFLLVMLVLIAAKPATGLSYSVLVGMVLTLELVFLGWCWRSFDEALTE